MRVALVFLLLASASPALAVDVQRELAAAEDLALRGRAPAAIDAYQELLERGVDFPALRYNLGTLYLERGDVGRAILNLRACLRERPRHEDAAYNLARAEAARADQVDTAARRPLSARVAATVSSAEAAAAFLALSALVALLVAASGWTRGRARRAVAVALLASALPWLAAGGVLWARVIADYTAEAVVLSEEVAARKGPSDEAATTFLAHPGLYGAVVAEENGYARVRLDSGLDAWLPSDALGFLGR